MAEYRAEDFFFKLDLSRPLYGQVLDQIRLGIARGEIELSSKIPSIRELAQGLKVNPNTIMRAYQELDRDGLIETRIGQGTYITSSAQKVDEIKRNLASSAIQAFIEAMKKLGLDRKAAEALLKEAKWQ